MAQERAKTARNISLLDCTLRDGGYINDWLFGHDALVNIFERLVSAGVDIIEVGFIDDRRPFDYDRSIFPDTAAVEKVFGGLDRGGSMVVGMIDYGTCALEHVQPCSECWLDGIRVIFKKHIKEEAFAYCAALKALGYKVFAQAVSITSYDETELLEFIELANSVKPYAVSLVDTYGLLHQSDLIEIVKTMDERLLPEIGLGYHAHNNFQMGYANAIAFLKDRSRRSLVVDATLYGMGKSAGNAPIELLSMHMNSHLGKTYDINQMLEAIQTSVMDVYKKSPWGYNLFYYVAASNKVHPSYVSYLMNKRTLSITEQNEILQQIDEEKKLLYDKDYIERLYLRYQQRECNDAADIAALQERWRGKEFLLLGPGTSVVKNKERIQALIESNACEIISINYIYPVGMPAYLFLTNSQRYVQLCTQLSKAGDSVTTVATSNVTCTAGKFAYKVNYSSLIDTEQKEIPDNSLRMLLKLLEKMDPKKVYLAGFDGYVPDDVNYFDIKKEYSYIREKANFLNEYGTQFIREFKEKFPIEFITPSKYQEEEK